MRQIYVFDTTLRDGEQSPGASLTQSEKLEIAIQLERLGVNRIEAGFPAASPGDAASVEAIARVITSATVVGLSRAREQDIDIAYQALKPAADPCIHIFLATSPIHREFKLRMGREEVLEAADHAIRYAKKLFHKVQFSAEDASRTELDFLCEVVEVAVNAGAAVINLPDTVGYATPEEYGNMFKVIRETVPGIDNVQLSCHCHNDLGMATANSLAALYNGAHQIEGTINGIGERAGNTAIEEVVMALETRRDVFQMETSLVLKEIYKSSRMVSKLSGMVVPGNKAIVGANAFSHESGIHQDGMLKNSATYEIMTPESIGLTASKLVLGKLSGRHALKEKLIDMGYHLNDTQLGDAFAKFKELADKKKNVLDDDIRAIMEEKLADVAKAFTLDYIHVNYGNQAVPTAFVRMILGEGKVKEEVAMGNGSVDAIYNAIDRATEEDVELEDYSIKSVTQGKDALGEVHVVLKQAEYTAQGRGISTDILEASAKAYVDALNRLVDKQAMNAEQRRGGIAIS